MTSDLFDLPTKVVKTYRVHGCHRRHLSYREWARCSWPSAAFGSGDGPYCTIARCRRRAATVHLHSDIDAALGWLAVIDGPTGCGGRCLGRHELVRIDLRAD